MLAKKPHKLEESEKNATAIKSSVIIPAVGLDGLNLAEDDPEPEGDHVARGDGGAGEGGDPEDEDLGPVGVGRGEPDGRRELVVHPVDVLITPLAVQPPVDPVVEVVLHQEVHRQLRHHLPPRRQRQPRPYPDPLF